MLQSLIKSINLSVILDNIMASHFYFNAPDFVWPKTPGKAGREIVRIYSETRNGRRAIEKGEHIYIIRLMNLFSDSEGVLADGCHTISRIIFTGNGLIGLDFEGGDYSDQWQNAKDIMSAGAIPIIIKSLSVCHPMNWTIHALYDCINFVDEEMKEFIDNDLIKHYVNRFNKCGIKSMYFDSDDSIYAQKIKSLAGDEAIKAVPGAAEVFDSIIKYDGWYGRGGSIVNKRASRNRSKYRKTHRRRNTYSRTTKRRN